MKKVLLGSTALVAMGALAAPALAADPIELSLGGYWYGFWGFELDDQDDAVGQPGANKRDHGFLRESEIRFRGETTLDNGITVGVDFQLEGETCGDQIDESYVYFDGNFGRVEFGAIDGVAFRTSVFLPSAYFFGGPNYGAVIWGNNNAAGATVQSITAAWTYPGVAWVGDNEKVNYFTPRISGFQLGVSYTPEACELNNNRTAGDCSYFGAFSGDNNNATASWNQSEVFEIGANYFGDVGDVSVALSVGYIDGESESTAAAQADRNELAVHGTLGFGAFTVGAGWRDDNQGLSGANTDTQVWAVSGNYNMGSWTFGAGYVTEEFGAGAAGGKDEIEIFAAGVTYALGPGIILMGGIDSAEYEDNLNNAAGENSFTSLTVGSYISF